MAVLVDIGAHPDAVAKLLAKSPVASKLRTAEWERLPVAIRERSQFSAGVENMRVLTTIQSKLVDRVNLAKEQLGNGKEAFVDRSSFIGDLRKITKEEGLGDGSGGLTDIRSRQRLGLIYDMQTQMAAGFARHKSNQDPDVLDAYPAQELIREEDRMVPRDWSSRWAAAGGQLYGGRMIALKSDPVWSAISRFGTPWPPFDFGSGMGIEDIDRDEAEALGLIAKDEEAKPIETDFNDRLEASTEEVPETMRQEFKQMYGDKVSVAGNSVAWVGDQGVEIGKLWDKAVAGQVKPFESYELGPVGDTARKLITEVRPQWDLTKVQDAVSNKDFRHPFDRHGGDNEKDPNQIGLDREDALRIPLVLDSPDQAFPGRWPSTVALVRKFMDGTQVYVEVMQDGKKQKGKPKLMTKTMWKMKPGVAPRMA